MTFWKWRMSMPESEVVSFFDATYHTEPERSDSLFGICDSIGSKPAYTTTDRESTDDWCAEVSNQNNRCVRFVPIDNNIIFRDSNGNELSSCDGMIVGEDNGLLVFVELKDVGKSWMTDAINQLKETILRFNTLHNYQDFLHRKAYASNRQHPKNDYSSKREILQQFYQQTHFRLSLDYRILIK